MKVAQEMITVVVDSDAREVFIVLAGLRVTLTQDETASLTETLFNGLERLAPKSAADGGTNDIITIGSLRGDIGRAAPDEIGHNDGHDRMRALIKARIREKGLAIWEERHS